VEELRNKTMGVIGYGDIGQAAARIARAFGMRIIALRRNSQLSQQETQDNLTVRSGLVQRLHLLYFSWTVPSRHLLGCLHASAIA
jgi:lactate dehydrogenase-like 2-hydroxyacid dehydrogenase